MSNSVIQKNIPNGWQVRQFDDCVILPTKLKGLKNSEYKVSGEYPIFDQANEYISGYTDDQNLLNEKYPAILFGDHTRVLKYIKTPFVLGADGTKVFWSAADVDPSFLYYSLLKLNIPNTGYNRHFKFLKDSKILLPEKSEQKKIAEILGSVDDEIAKTEEVILKNEKLKKGLMKEVFKNTDLVLLDTVAKRGSGHTPNKQHPEYWDGGIKWVSLTDSSKLDNRYIYETDKEISDLGIENSSAVLHPKNTVVVCRDAGIGKTAILGADNMAVSQHFIAWQCSEKLNFKYLYYWIQSQRNIFEQIATGTTIKTIGLPFFKKLQIPLPNIPDQEKIANLFWEIDEKTLVNQKMKEKLLQLKKGLMQDLLTGKVRTI